MTQSEEKEFNELLSRYRYLAVATLSYPREVLDHKQKIIDWIDSKFISKEEHERIVKEKIEKALNKNDSLWSETLHSWDNEIYERMKFYRNNPDEEYLNSSKE